MVQSIELLFDEETEARVRASWDALRDAGLPSLATHTGETNRPHVTVAVTDEGDLLPAVEALRAVFAGWDLAGRGLAAVIGSPILFGGHRHRWVLARQMVPSRPLLTVHAAVARAVAEAAPDAEVHEQTRPDGWTAHVSLARRIPEDRVGEALGVVDAEPIPCRFTGARLWDSVPKTVTPLV